MRRAAIRFEIPADDVVNCSGCPPRSSNPGITLTWENDSESLLERLVATDIRLKVSFRG